MLKDPFHSDHKHCIKIYGQSQKHRIYITDMHTFINYLIVCLFGIKISSIVSIIAWKLNSQCLINYTLQGHINFVL